MNKGNVRLASEGQLDELRIAVEKAVNKLRGRIDATTAQGWIGNSEALDRWAEQLLPSQEANTPVVYLRPISPEEGVAIGPTSGTRTFANSANILRGHLDANFERWGTNKPSLPTGEAKADVYEHVTNGSFATILLSLPRPRKSLFWRSQDQAIEFVVKHPEWLHPDGYATFIPFMVDGEEFVAHVDRYSVGRLVAYVRRFAHVVVWGAESRNRFVIPQLDTLTA